MVFADPKSVHRSAADAASAFRSIQTYVS